MVQFIVGTTRQASVRQLQNFLRQILPPELQAPGDILWWTPTANADFIFAPTVPHAIPGVIAEIRRGIRAGHPAIKACVTNHGIALEGVSPPVVPGFLTAIGLGTPIHGLQSVGKGPMFYPFRVAKQGRLDPGTSIEGWRISCAMVDNDHLFIIEEDTLSGQQVRAAVAQAVAQPCTV